MSYLRDKPKVTFPRLGSHGQFGNQLFQISACLGYAARFGAEPRLPEWVCSYSGINYGNIFEGIKKYYGQLPRATLYQEQNFTYADIPLMQKIDLRGNFQCERYFENAEEQIRSIFAEPVFITKQLDEYILENKLGAFSAIHFRSYSHPVNDLNHPMARLPEAYYLSALQALGDSKSLLIATDDKEFVASFLARHHIRRDVHVLTFDNPLLDFFALTRAKHLAISNSSFSWWAAYLSNAKRVSAPHRYFWFSDHVRRNPFWDTRTLYPKHFQEIII